MLGHVADFGYSRLGRSGGRNATVYDDDRFVASFQRSGSTWMMFMLTTLLHADEPTTFANYHARHFDFEGRSDHELKRLPRPRLVKTHTVFRPRYRRVLYLVRDPLDVAVSYHRMLTKMRSIPVDLPLESFLDTHFLRQRPGAPDEGSWGENVGSWVGARDGDGDFLVLRYEDALDDPLTALMRAAEHLHVPATTAACRRAVSLCSVERMRESERTDFAATWMHSSRLEIPFIDGARAGEGRERLSEDDQLKILDRWWPLIERLGYAPVAIESRPKPARVA